MRDINSPEWEREFVTKMGFPFSELSAEERHRRRLAYRNERTLYQDVCDLCKKNIISLYSPDKNATVYCQTCWWGDGWDARSYSQDYDFSKPFFEQFKELQDRVPRLSLINSKGENSEYCNATTENRNCYLVFGGDYNEDCYDSVFNFHCKDVCDVYFVDNSTLCYECIDCSKCYNVTYSQNSQNCSDSAFLFDCRSVKNCFGCVGLRNKEYHIFNEPHSKEDYENIVTSFKLNSWNNAQEMKKRFNEFKLKFPHLYANIVNSENCTGDNILNSKNCINCFDTFDKCEDLKDVMLAGNIKDGYSCSHIGHNSELCYECFGTVSSYHCAFCAYSWGGNKNIYYCINAANSCEDLFGCTQIKKAKYCILNKQYTKEEYEALLPRIIDHMKKNNEWGHFFPMKNSHFAYNETVANDFWPLTKEKVIEEGLTWHDEEKRNPGSGANIPDSIQEISDDILKETLVCEVTGRPFRITLPELRFHRDMKIPIPHYAPETRNRMRFNMRNPHHLWERTCVKCQTPITTTYAPNRPEQVYCEKYYLETVY